MLATITDLSSSTNISQDLYSTSCGRDYLTHGIVANILCLPISSFYHLKLPFRLLSRSRTSRIGLVPSPGRRVLHCTLSTIYKRIWSCQNAQ